MAGSASQRWLPTRFGERIGAALIAPTRALAAADHADAAGRAGSDVAALIGLVFLAAKTRALVAAGWLCVAIGVGLGLGTLLASLSRTITMDLVFLVCAAVGITALAGRRRDLGRDFDLACVALVPLVTVDLLSNLIFRLVEVRATGAIADATAALAYGWAAAIALLAVRQARSRGGHTATNDRDAATNSNDIATDGDAAADDDSGADATETAVAALAGRAASRWAFRAIAAAVGLLLALNAIWIARNLDALRPVAPGDLAPVFALPVIDDAGRVGPQTVDLASLRGQVVLLDFWATWCGPCKQSMPGLNELHQTYRARGFTVLSINTDSPLKARAFADQYGLVFPMVMDRGDVADRYRVTALPHMVLVDRLGVVRLVSHGSEGKAGLANKIEQLLRPPPL